MHLSKGSQNSDIMSLLVQAGHAEFWDIDVGSLKTEHKLPDSETKYKRKRKSHLSIEKYCAKGDIKVSLRDWATRTKNKEQNFVFCNPINTLGSGVSPVAYSRYIFKPGAVLNVKCSHVESPGNFWCQLSCNLTTLYSLMDEIQAFYKASNNGYRHGQIACVAKSSCTGKYYRAAVRKYISKNEVEVIFVDFGKVEKVLVSELREIQPQFLKREGQAFRCCLSKVLLSCGQHKSLPNACRDFKSFVDSDNIFKCTIVALFSIGSGELFNAVNLETQHNAIVHENHYLASKERFNDFEGTIPSLHLHTFCYSSFDLDVGSKENIYITYILDTGTFYCQLAKNEHAWEMLVNKICELGEKIKPVTEKKMELCIVKYVQDGNFYRALACPVDKLYSLVFFVDFGDSQVVKKTELLPIPLAATDVLFEPMQALPCFLSGLKEVSFTMEAKAWFQEECLNTLVSAAIISKDDVGQLELELFNGDISINHEIKKILGLDLLQRKEKNIPSAGCTISQLPVCEKSSTKNLRKKTNSHDRLSDLNGNEIYKNTASILDGPQNSLCKQKEQTLDDQALESTNATSVEPFRSPQNLKKSSKMPSVPQLNFKTGSSHLVFASYVIGPSEFYVQLAKNEKLIMKLEEQLNDMPFQPTDVKHLEKGVLVVARYPDDNAFYRAEIKEMLKGNSFKVEFIDYGNAAIVDISSIFTLPEAFLNVPRLSIPVFLKDFHRRQNCEWNADVVDNFCEKLTNESFDCVFLCRHEDQWEVSITSEGLSEFFSNSKIMTNPSSLDINETVSNFDAILKPGLIEKVKHIYFSENGMFVTLARHSQESKIIDYITAAVQQITNRLKARDISEGMLCLAKSKKMQAWFRGSVEEIFPETLEMRVLFVDHGASEVISMHNAIKLNLTALSIPPQAITCKWNWSEKVKMDSYSSQVQSLLQRVVQVQFLEFVESQRSWEVELLVDGLMLKDVFNVELYKAEQKRTNQQSCFHFEYKKVSIPRNSLKLLEVRPGYITTFQNPFGFAIQMEESLYSMNKLSQMLENIPDDLSNLPLDSLRLGSACLINSFVNKEWCRAEIVSINASSILLNLFDYGVYKFIPYSDYSKLKTISKGLTCLPPLTYNCRLHGVIPKVGTSWSEHSIKYCLEFFKGRDLLILPIKMNAGVAEVSIYGAGNLAEKLVSKGFAKISNKE